MPNITLVYSILLIILGLASYFGTGMESATALIPAFFGLALGVLGLVALDEKRRKHAMHGAAALGLLAFLGAAPGLFQLPALLGGGGVERPVAVLAQSVMALLSLIFVGLCVKTFVDARRARQTSTTA